MVNVLELRASFLFANDMDRVYTVAVSSNISETNAQNQPTECILIV